MDISFAYDLAGRRSRMTDSTGTTRYQHDATGRLLTQTRPDQRRIQYEYDQAGRVQGVTDYDGDTLRYEHDGLGRLTTIRSGASGPISIRYNAAGRRDQIQYPGGITGRYEYDAAGRMATLAWQRPDGSELERFTYGYDGRGNIVRKTDARGATDYEYDPLSRLTRETGPDLTAEYTYDDAGNRLRRTVTLSGREETTDYRYDAANRLLQAGGRTYTWDVRGNQLSDGEKTYRFDGLDRLVAVTAPGGREIRYAYGGDGLQVTRQVGGETTRLYWDRGQVVMETDGNGLTGHGSM